MLYEHVAPGVPMERYTDQLTWWELEPIMENGNLAGVLMAFRNRLHIFVRPESRGRWFRRWMVAWMQERIAEFGPITVAAIKDNPGALAFLERLGFKRTSEGESVIHLELRRASICLP